MEHLWVRSLATVEASPALRGAATKAPPPPPPAPTVEAVAGLEARALEVGVGGLGRGHGARRDRRGRRGLGADPAAGAGQEADRGRSRVRGAEGEGGAEVRAGEGGGVGVGAIAGGLRGLARLLGAAGEGQGSAKGFKSRLLQPFFVEAAPSRMYARPSMFTDRENMYQVSTIFQPQLCPLPRSRYRMRRPCYLYDTPPPPHYDPSEAHDERDLNAHEYNIIKSLADWEGGKSSWKLNKQAQVTQTEQPKQVHSLIYTWKKKRNEGPSAEGVSS